MEITTLSDLLREGLAKEVSGGIVIDVRPSLIISGEDRLSYTSIIRLVECSREHHWQKDVLDSVKDGRELDSICRSLSADFKEPILVGSRIQISYFVTEVRNKSYKLQFSIDSEASRHQYATVEMTCVFYNPVTLTAAAPPPFIMGGLAELQKRSQTMRRSSTNQKQT